MRNNKLKITIDQAKSKLRIDTSDLRSFPTKKDQIKEFIKKVILLKGYCSYAQGTIASFFKVRRQYVNEIYQELKDDPTYTISTKRYFTCIVSFTFLITSLLPANKALIKEYKNYNINSYSTDTKRSATDELILKNRETKRVEELKRERLTTNVHKIFYDETYPGDVYVSKYHKREVSKSMYDDEAQPKFTNKPDKHRSNVSAYRPYVHEERAPESRADAMATMIKDDFLKSPEWDAFVRLMGKEAAIEWFKAGLYQATRK